MESSTVDRLTWRPLLAIWLITTLVGLLALDARATYGARVTADEPQYLLTALSLSEDLDLDISDELEAERFRDFHEVALNPQTIDLDGSGQRISPHDPLLPLLLAPAMGLGGWALAKATLAVLAGLTAALTARLANHRLGVGPVAAGAVTLGMFCSPPLTAYATQIYPELPAALAVVVGLIGLLGLSADKPTTDRINTRRQQAAVIAAVVSLPWLSVKYVPVAAVLAVALLFNHSGNRRRWQALALAAILGVFGAIYLIAHQRIYGGWTVYASGDHFVDGEFQVVGTDPDYVGRSRRLIGLLVDRRFGLVPWAPTFLLLVPALAAVARRPRWPRTLLLGVFAAGWAVATWVALTMHGWWWPGRQVVVVLPIAVVAIAGFVDGRRRLLAATAVLSVAAAGNWLWLAFEASTDRRTLIVDFHESTAPLYRLWAPLFPDHIRYSTGDELLTALWIAAAIVAAVFGWRSTREPENPCRS